MKLSFVEYSRFIRIGDINARNHLITNTMNVKVLASGVTNPYRCLDVSDVLASFQSTYYVSSNENVRLGNIGIKCLYNKALHPNLLVNKHCCHCISMCNELPLTLNARMTVVRMQDVEPNAHISTPTFKAKH